jgi:hypothetical protein
MELTSSESTADLFERRWLADWPNGEAAARDAVASLQKRGATFMRFSFRPLTGLILVEGWLDMPDDQGDLPL